MTRALAAFVLALATTASAADAWKIVRRTSIDGGAHEVQTEYWERGRVVVDDPAQRTTVDFRAGTATVVDKERRTTSTIELEDLRRALVAIGALVDWLPPAARDALGTGRTVTLASTGNFTTIAGHRAREYGVGGDGVTGWVWLAEDVDPREILGDDASAWWRAGGPLRAITPLADVMRAIESGHLRGMPVWAWLTIGSTDGTTTIASDVISITKEQPPSAPD